MTPLAEKVSGAIRRTRDKKIEVYKDVGSRFEGLMEEIRDSHRELAASIDRLASREPEPVNVTVDNAAVVSEVRESMDALASKIEQLATKLNNPPKPPRIERKPVSYVARITRDGRGNTTAQLDPVT